MQNIENVTSQSTPLTTEELLTIKGGATDATALIVIEDMIAL